MASYDYYNSKPLPPPGGHSPQPSPMGYGGSRYNDPVPPPYSSQQHLGPDRPAQAVSPANNASPFESVFDDHVYPANSHQSGGGRHQHQQHQQQDTGYYGLGRTGSEDNMNGSDDIPLQNRYKDPNSPD